MMNDYIKHSLVLYYHRVSDIEDDPFGLCVTVDNFEKQMNYLYNNFIISRFEDKHCGEDNQVIITFDDGYKDNLTNALPILEKYRIPATVFVSTEHLNDNGIMWWDELFELIVKQNYNDRIVIDDQVFGCEWVTNNRELKYNCYYAVHKLMNHYISIDKKDEWLRQLRLQVKLDGSEKYKYQLLNKDDLVRLSKSELITIGGHTVSHMSLAKLTKNEQEYEITECIKTIEGIISKKVVVFSYPFGTNGVDVDNTTTEIMRKTGVLRAATTFHKLWAKDDDPLLIPRCEVHNWGRDDFGIELKRYWSML